MSGDRQSTTHKNGHTLDLFITRADDDLVSNIMVYIVHCSLLLEKPRPQRKEISYRKIHSVDVDCFINDTENSSLLKNYNTIDNATDLYELYDVTLSSVLDSHAPLKCVVIERPSAPWYTEDIRIEKGKRRRLERLWRRNKLTINRDMYVEQCKLVVEAVVETRRILRL